MQKIEITIGPKAALLILLSIVAASAVLGFMGATWHIAVIPASVTLLMLAWLFKDPTGLLPRGTGGIVPILCIAATWLTYILTTILGSHIN